MEILQEEEDYLSEDVDGGSIDINDYLAKKPM